jgi:hypothetical protein
LHASMAEQPLWGLGALKSCERLYWTFPIISMGN